MLTVGSTAPNFTAQDDRGQTVKLADFSGKKNVVLIFYPMNETPGCTAQLCTARDDWKKYQEAGVQVFGVNTADQESHRKFAENHNFPFPLLADTEGAIVKDFGARGLMGMVKRTVYVIGKDGRILFAERGMPSTQTILAAIPQPTS
jgi:peroxiredoxin Q/BCP